MVDGLDHVRLAMPRGGEERAWAYFGGLLGLVELEKPAALDGLARRLGEGGYAVQCDGALSPRRRFYGEDPFGNRIEFIEP